MLNIGMNYGGTLNRGRIGEDETRRVDTKKGGNEAKINIIYDD